MTPAVATVLAPFFAFMQRNQIYPKITHIPGHLNDIADALSRFKQPLPEPLTLSNQWVVRWQTLLDSALIFTAQSGRRWPHRFGIGEKWFLQSPLTQGSSIDRLWGFAPAGRFSIYIGVWYPPLHSQVLLPRHLGMYVCAVWGCLLDLYHIVLRWTRWYHARLYKLTDLFCTTIKVCAIAPCCCKNHVLCVLFYGYDS